MSLTATFSMSRTDRGYTHFAGPVEPGDRTAAPLKGTGVPASPEAAIPTGAASKSDRAFARISWLCIVTMLNVICIAWTCPIVIQVARWAGFSVLDSIHAGLIAMAVSVPVALIATAIAWRRYARSLMIVNLHQ